MARGSNDKRIFFPWEGRGGFFAAIGRGRVRPLLIGALVVGFVVVVGVRERNRAGLRQTRATLLDARAAVDAYMAQNDGGCPPSLEAVAALGPFQGVPRDAWGRPLRLICPGRDDTSPYDLMSDGPDGKPGGLDRIR